MKLKKEASPFLATQLMIKSGLFNQDPFVLIDIGCSGGINSRWRIFGNDLKAFGIDPVIKEIKRLKAEETLDGIHYWAGYIDLPDEHPVKKERELIGPWGNNPWKRLSCDWAHQFLSVQTDEKNYLSVNKKEMTQLAQPSCRKSLDDFVKTNGIDNVDFVKVDIDGNDLYALMSGENLFTSGNVIGVELEVNFYGTECPTDNTFHNIDRIMRAYGFELFDLRIRRYSRKHLPAPFLLRMPAQTEWGATLQGDAIYMLDLAGQLREEATYPPLVEKILKLIALFEIMRLPDCAVELILAYSKLLSNHIDTETLLDLLTPLLNKKSLHYREYIDMFVADPTRFYPPLLSKRQKLFNLIKRLFIG